jgi:hypothetical protein
VRLGPDDDECAVTVAQVREVVTRLAAAGQWKEGDPEIVVAMDAGYDVTRLAWLLADLPVVLVDRVRSDRVFYRAAPPRAPGRPGRGARHGPALRCAASATWDSPAVRGEGRAASHGPVAVTAWNRVHQALSRASGGWEH